MKRCEKVLSPAQLASVRLCTSEELSETHGKPDALHGRVKARGLVWAGLPFHALRRCELRSRRTSYVFSSNSLLQICQSGLRLPEVSASCLMSLTRCSCSRSSTAWSLKCERSHRALLLVHAQV